MPACLYLHVFGLLFPEASLMHPSGAVSTNETAGMLPEEHRMNDEK